MGIDKPDVRFVVHMDLPDTLEAYFQEAGRAGRDEKKAYAVLLFNNTDKVSIDRRIAASFPDIKEIKKVYQALGNFLQIPIGSGKGIAYDFNMGSFAAAYKLNILTTFSSLRVLQKEGYIEFTEEVHNPSVLHFKMNRDDLYKFQVANEGFDGFIKLVLRLYSGLFSDFVAINEQQLAKKAGIHIEQVYKYLKHLNQYGVVKYIPQRQTPYIVFTEERLDDKTLYISHENYKFRKERYVDRIQTVLDYATENKKCRSQQLLAYFGEKESYPCGQCDVCISKNELDMSRYEFNLMMNDIMHQTVVNPVSLDELVDNLSKRYQEDKLIKVIQWLLDNSELIYNSERNLSWQGKVPKK
jgi:ATP-dependent DNA helicase RecQ